jgi:hypothetical protein
MSSSFIDRVKREDLRAPAKADVTPTAQPAAPERQTLTDSMASQQESPSEYVDPKLLSQVVPRTLGQAVKPATPNGDGQSEGQGEAAGGGRSHVHPRSYQDGQAIAGVSSAMGLAGGQADESPARRHEKAAPEAPTPNAAAPRDDAMPSDALPRSLSDATQRKAPEPAGGDDPSNPFANIKAPADQVQHPKVNIFGTFMPGEDNNRKVDEPKPETPKPEAPTPTRRRPRM